jgi:hypothetical protein
MPALKARDNSRETDMQKVAILAAETLALSASSALAVSQAVRKACSADYAAYCSDYKVGTAKLRSCMKKHSHMLTGECIKALGHSNEVTQQDIRDYKAGR